MALDRQTLNIATAQGLDTKTDPKQEGKGFFVTLQNVVFRTISELRKRYGFDVIATSILGGGNITTGVQIATFSNELMQSDGASLYSYASTNGSWVNRGAMPLVNLTAKPVIRNSYQQTAPDSAYLNGYQCFVWEDSSGGVRCSIIDAATGTAVLSNTLVAASAISPKVFGMTSGPFVITYISATGSGILQLSYISTAAPTTINGPSNIATDLHATDQNYDGSFISGVASRVYVAYNNNAGGTTQLYLNTTPAVVVTYTLAGDPATKGITVFGDTSGRPWMAYGNATTVKLVITNASLTTPVLAATTIEAAVIRNITGVVTGTNPATIYYEIAGTGSPAPAGSYNKVRYNTCTSAGSVGTPADFIRQVGLASKAFRYNSVNYVMVTHQSTLQSTYFLINGNNVCVSRIAQDNGGGLTTRSILPEFNAISSGNYQTVYLQKDSLIASNGGVYSQTGVQSATYNIITATTQAVPLAQNQNFSGGIVWIYDGTGPVEQGFHLYPENITLVAGDTVPGAIGNGTYSYVSIYEWTDNQGQTNRSGVSPAVQVVIAGSDDTVTATIPMLPITQRQSPRSPVSIVLYRTENAGTVYYRVSTITPLVYNVVTTDTVTIVDTLADSSIIGNEQLYTTGGEVENDPMPPTDLLQSYKNRIIAVPRENTLQWWYSKQVIPGSPVEFSLEFVSNIDQRIVSITATATMDDKFIFFGPGSLFYMAGDGPTPAGTNNDFSDPQLVSSDVGCANQASIVVMPNGLMFQTPAKGIYLLDRSLQVSYIGAPVSSFNSYTVTSALLVKNQNQVRFTLSNGTILTYDYFVGQWANQTGLSAVGAVIWNSIYTYLKSNAVAYQENTSSYGDNGAQYNMTFKTGWYSFAGVQGYQRARNLLILGEYKSAHTLTVNIYYDFSLIAGQTVTIPVLTDPGIYQFRVHLSQQKCEAIQVEIIESQPGGGDPGESFSLSNLAVEVGVKKGLNKLPAAASYG